MTKLVSVTTRLGQDTLDYIKKISKMLDIDQSAAFRHILQRGMEEDKREKALQMYIKGKFSIGQAARFADLTVGEFFEQMRAKGVESNLSAGDFADSLKHAKRLHD